MKGSSIKLLTLGQIAFSDYFYIAPPPDNRLSGILELAGIQAHLWVLEEQPDCYALVDGYVRWEWAKNKSLIHVPCIVFPISTPREDLLRARILIKISERPLNLEEKAVIVKKLLQFYSVREVEQLFFPILRLPLKPDLHKRLTAIATASEDFRQAIRTGIIDDKVAIRLSLWDERSKREVLRMFNQIQCSVSLQREILDYLEDMARQQNISPADVLTSSEITSIIFDTTLNARQKTERIRNFFKNRLFPHLAAREASFRQFVESLKLPQGVVFTPPDQFEGDDWEVKISFTKPEDLMTKFKAISEKITPEVLKIMCYGDRE
ncbi:MAG: hypothetical protein WHS38_09800 [Thermodesulforhabdaceae bacterium]